MGFYRSVEREFPHDDVAAEPVGGYLSRCGEDGYGNGQVERRALLADVCRCEVYDHLLAGHLQSAVVESRTDALLAFAHGVIGQPDQKHAQTGG